MSKMNCILCDIDGTLTRDPLLIDDKSREGRDIFYQKIDNYLRVKKELIRPVVSLLQVILNNTNTRIIFLTAREDRYDIRENTIKFLEDKILCDCNNCCYELYMREENDLRPNYQVKKQILQEQILPFYDVLFALDDEDGNVEMFRRNGILTLQVKDVAK